MLNLNQLADEFNNLYDAKVSTVPVKLIMAEYNEMMAEIENTPDHAKECIDIIYITATQARAMGYDIQGEIQNLLRYHVQTDRKMILKSIQALETFDVNSFNMACIIATVVDYIDPLGYDTEKIFNEVHRSNMSKSISKNNSNEFIYDLLEESKSRYPFAELIDKGSYFVLECQFTKKIIKPSSYSPADIKEKWLSC